MTPTLPKLSPEQLQELQAQLSLSEIEVNDLVEKIQKEGMLSQTHQLIEALPAAVGELLAHLQPPAEDLSES